MIDKKLVALLALLGAYTTAQPTHAKIQKNANPVSDNYHSELLSEPDLILVDRLLKQGHLKYNQKTNTFEISDSFFSQLILEGVIREEEISRSNECWEI